MNSKPPSRFERYSWLILALFVIATPLLTYTAYLAVQCKTNQVNDWLPESYSETEDLTWFREHFVADQFVVISWDGCRLGGNPISKDAERDDPRIEQLANLLVPAESSHTAETAGPNPLLQAKPLPFDAAKYFKSVTTGRRLLNQLTSDPMNVRYSAAVNRLRGSLVGSDGRQTCVVATLADEALVELRDTLGRGSDSWLQFQHKEGVLFAALCACDIDLDSVHLGGPPVDSVAIDEEGERTLLRLAGYAALVGVLLAWWSLRSIKLTLIVFTCGLLSAVASLSAVWLTGGTTDAFLLSMPSLVYVLAISGAVHLIKYYRDEVEEHGLPGAPKRALIHGWKPTLLCSVTTGIGLLALCTSDLAPVRKFGIYSALGVMVMLITLFVFLPAALQVWPIRTRKKTKLSKSQNADGQTISPAGFSFDAFWMRFGGWIIRHYKGVTAGCAILIITAGIGFMFIRTNIDLMKLFESNARIRQDYQWLETNVGRLVPMEIVLRFDQESMRRQNETPVDRERFSFLERMETVARVQKAIAVHFGPNGKNIVSPSMSPVTFVPPLPRDRKNARSHIERSLTNTKLKSSFDALVDSGYLAKEKTDGSELWRISLRVSAFKDVDYGLFTEELRQVVDPVVTTHNKVLNKRKLTQTDANESANVDDQQYITTVYTGVVPIVYKAQRALLDSLIESTFWSFITITPLLMFVSRGFWAGATAMLPNTLPVLVIFGGMGWLGVPVALGSMMSASIALGVAVDDTIHYLMWFRIELNESSDRHKASLAAYRRCATPTLQAALISGFGMSVFGLSTFAPTKQFGLLMLAILLAGVVAELILLPALLAGPLGKAFQPKSKVDVKND